MEITGSSASAQYLAANRPQANPAQAEQSREAMDKAQQQGQSAERPPTDRVESTSGGQRIDTYA
jgi:hypothetical protein